MWQNIFYKRVLDITILRILKWCEVNVVISYNRYNQKKEIMNDNAIIALIAAFSFSQSCDS